MINIKVSFLVVLPNIDLILERFLLILNTKYNKFIFIMSLFCLKIEHFNNISFMFSDLGFLIFNFFKVFNF